MLEYTNSVLDTPEAYICNSRPRRFGKSYTANMLAAYYSKGCDSEKDVRWAYNRQRVATSKKHHQTKYDVIQYRCTMVFVQLCRQSKSIISYITQSVLEELKRVLTLKFFHNEVLTLADALSRIRKLDRSEIYCDY